MCTTSYHSALTVNLVSDIIGKSTFELASEIRPWPSLLPYSLSNRQCLSSLMSHDIEELKLWHTHCAWCNCYVAALKGWRLVSWEMVLKTSKYVPLATIASSALWQIDYKYRSRKKKIIMTRKWKWCWKPTNMFLLPPLHHHLFDN